jgi:hypothetical protein
MALCGASPPRPLSPELPSRPAHTPVPVFTWNGLTLVPRSVTPGAKSITWSGISTDDELARARLATPQGVIGGAHVGYNLKYNPWLVFGLGFLAARLSHTLAVPGMTLATLRGT